MAERTKHEPGTFSWVELATRDSAAAKRFYTSLFGWGVDEMPVGDGTTYTMLTKNGKRVGALYQMSAQQQGVPPHWNSYVTVASADDSAAQAKKLGGNVMLEPFDVLDAGRMAVVADPTGAVFSLWQPKRHIGADLVNEPGAFCWNELYTTDPNKAADFYMGLFGWTKDARHMDYGEYVIFNRGGRQMCGMMQIPKEWGPVPPHWLVYFAVDDCDASVAKATSLGAKAMMPPMDIENVGRFAMLTDPEGAGFAVIKLNAPAP
jgi:predicted enzyme related to lactoylglutathione lyase